MTAENVGRLDLLRPYGTCYMAPHATTTALEAIRLQGLTAAEVQAAAADRHMSAMSLQKWSGRRIADFTRTVDQSSGFHCSVSSRMPKLGPGPRLPKPPVSPASSTNSTVILNTGQAWPVFGNPGAMNTPPEQGAGQPLVVRYLHKAVELPGQDAWLRPPTAGDPLSE